jgi:hypothetical protein
MTSTSSTSHTWYLDANEYYVSEDEVAAYPVRQGDLFPADLPEITEWHACQLVHPTCELNKASVEQVQVIRVEPLTRVGDPKQQATVVVGFSEKGGVFRIAHAHTFFLPPYADGIEPMFSNFREVQTVARDGFTFERRLAALTHDARVTFIRREMYFRYRHALTFEDVRKLEAQRISNDPAFQGPRPSWASAAT